MRGALFQVSQLLCEAMTEKASNPCSRTERQIQSHQSQHRAAGFCCPTKGRVDSQKKQSTPVWRIEPNFVRKDRNRPLISCERIEINSQKRNLLNLNFWRSKITPYKRSISSESSQVIWSFKIRYWTVPSKNCWAQSPCRSYNVAAFCGLAPVDKSEIN